MAKNNEPAGYQHLRHGMWLVVQEFYTLGLAAAVVVFYVYMTWLSGFNLMGLVVCVLAFAALVVRALFGLPIAYRERPIRVSPKTGTLIEYQTGHWWLFTSSSPPDPASLDGVSIKTNQSVIQQMFFKDTGTVILMRSTSEAPINRLTWVRNMSQIVAINEFWNARANRLAARQISVLEEIAANQQETNTLLKRGNNGQQPVKFNSRGMPPPPPPV